MFICTFSTSTNVTALAHTRASGPRESAESDKCQIGTYCLENMQDYWARQRFVEPPEECSWKGLERPRVGTHNAGGGVLSLATLRKAGIGCER